MRRIGLAVVLAVSLLLAPLAAEAEQAGKAARVDVLMPSTLAATAPQIEAWAGSKTPTGEVRLAGSAAMPESHHACSKEAGR